MDEFTQLRNYPITKSRLAFGKGEGHSRVSMDRDKKFWIAMAAYAVLAVLAWATMTNAGIQVAGNGISLRGLVLILLGFFAARTVLHWRAEKIRAERGE
jgi:hypothetical protein